jgi:hypothetical protein
MPEDLPNFSIRTLHLSIPKPSSSIKMGRPIPQNLFLCYICNCILQGECFEINYIWEYFPEHDEPDLTFQKKVTICCQCRSRTRDVDDEAAYELAITEEKVVYEQKKQ